MSNLARTKRDWAVGAAASAFLIAGSATGFLSFSMTETLGFVTGALAVWLLVRESIWTWPAGVVNGVFYLVLFAHARFFADSALQVFFIILGLYGWWYWLGGRSNRAGRPIVRVHAPEAALLAVLTAAATYAMLVYLRSVGDAAPLADAATTALSLAASWMQARKQIENWVVWLAADAVYVPLYFVKGLPLTGTLYVVFAAMCVKGLIDWRRAAAGALPRHGRGAVIGKFMPFHTGHLHLIETALARADEVTVIVVARAGEPIPGELRRRWIEAALPDARVVLFDQDEAGLASEDTAGWAAATVELLGGRPDVVFTSEPYGRRWAKAMGCEHVLVDRRRRTVPVSGTRIRRDPLGNMRFLRGGARSHYVKRVCILGAESTGKTTLARALANRYGTLWNPEYGHVYSWFREADSLDWETWTTGEFVQIASLQNWYEDMLAEHADRVLFCDTDAWTTGLFHEVYLGRRSPEVDALGGRRYDLYIVCDGATAFVQDELGMRTEGPHRVRMHEAYLAHVRETGVPFVAVSGTHAERMSQASAAVDALLRGSAGGDSATQGEHQVELTHAEHAA